MRETARAKQAYADYTRLGPGRSLEKLLTGYKRRKQAPTTHISMLKAWSSAHNWQTRLEADADVEIKRAREEQTERRRQIMESGLALDFERVAILTERASALAAEISGKKAEFDEAKYRQLRGLLDDIAKEVGDRAQRHEYVLVERKAEELAIERGLDPGKIVNLAERMARRKVVG